MWNCVYDIYKLGDGICDDMISRTERCFNDFGDCCMTFLNTSRCTECICDYTQKYEGQTIEELFQSLQEPQDYWTHMMNTHTNGRTIMNPLPL